MRPTIISNQQALLTSIGVALLLMSGIACTAEDPAALPPGTPEPDRYLFEHGSTLFEDEDWDKAETVFRRLVDVDPHTRHPLELLEACHQRLGLAPERGLHHTPKVPRTPLKQGPR